MNICKMVTSGTQVNFDMQHNHTSLRIVEHASVWKLGLHTGSKDQKGFPIFSKYTHIDSVL